LGQNVSSLSVSAVSRMVSPFKYNLSMMAL